MQMLLLKFKFQGFSRQEIKIVKITSFRRFTFYSVLNRIWLLQKKFIFRPFMSVSLKISNILIYF